MQDDQGFETQPSSFDGPAIHAPEPFPKPPRVKKPAPKKPTPKPKKKNTNKGKKIKQSPAALAALDRTRHKDVLRSQQHNINRVRYGPGRVRVRGDIADTLLESEQRSAQVEQDFHDKRAFIIGGRGRYRQVPYDSFEYAYGATAPVPLSMF